MATQAGEAEAIGILINLYPVSLEINDISILSFLLRLFV